MQRPLLLTMLALAALLCTAPGALAAGLSERRVAPEREPAATQRARASQGMVAPRSACPGQDDAGAPAATQRRAMLCLTEYARRGAGLSRFADAERLHRSAERKSGDILRCDSFSHYACGRDFTFWMKRSGYLPAACWRAAENLAWGVGRAASPREIFRAWMHSPGHRRNILGRFAEIGVGLRVGSLEGRGETHVWTQHFGTHCGTRG